MQPFSRGMRMGWTVKRKAGIMLTNATAAYNVPHDKMFAKQMPP